MKVVLAVLLTVALTGPLLAGVKKFRVRVDGDIRFDVPVDGPTRMSVVGDRISKIVQSHSNFEMSNDENTGDVFLRFIGSELASESGYIITEAGHTVSFTMEPRPGLEKQTILISLIGVKPPEAKDEDTFATSQSGGGDDFVVLPGGTSGRTGSLVAFARAAIETRIGLRSAAASGSKQQSVYSQGDLRARVFSASAKGGRPDPQKFYSGSRTLAVYVDDVVSGGRVWVVVVEARK